MIDGSSIGVVLDAYGPEREALLDLLEGLDAGQWARRTECPAYSVKGIATHVLGDAQQTADVLTRAHPADELRTLVRGPAELVDLFAAVAGRR